MQLPINNVSIGSGNGLVPTRPQVLTWNGADPVQRREYAVLGGEELYVASDFFFYMKLDTNSQRWY